MTTTILRITLVALIVVAAGCNGPTKTGKKMRAEARTRLDTFTGEMAYDQAMRSFEVGQFDQAERQIGEAVARNPEIAKYYTLYGRIHLETHRLEDAKLALAKAIDLDPDSDEAHYFSGIVFQRWTDDETAFEHYDRAFEIDSANVQYLLAAAESLVALGRLDEARELVEPRFDEFEHNAALRHLLGQIALLQDRPAEAARLYAEARLLNPDDLGLLEELAWAQFAARQYAKCLSSVSQLQKSREHAKRSDLKHLEARCLSLTERTTDARDLYIELTRRDPSDADVWAELGCLSWELGDFRRVAETSVRLIAMAPERYEGYMLKGVHAHHAGNVDESIRLFRIAAERADDIAAPYLLLGRSLEESDRTDDAIEAYRAALRVEPSSREARARLALAIRSRDRDAFVGEDPARQYPD